MSALLTLLQLGLCLLLVAAATHLLRLARWAWRAPRRVDAAASVRPLPVDDLPHITVQLPMYNERRVAARAITAACALTYPRDRLHIQVLDDSTDDTRDLIDRTAADLRAAGHDVVVLRRPDRRAFKAGNLAHGLANLRADCPFVAILDADFVPPPDFLTRLLPSFQEGADAQQVGFVQARWAFLNGEQNLLTRLQALILDGLMAVEQAYLDAHGKPLQWNGTGGIWRTQALIDAGGWLGSGASTSVLTEDLDVSYRALLRGYRGRQRADVSVPSELPAAMSIFLTQQQRWVGGGVQVLRNLLRQIGQTGLRPRDLITLLSHLARHARQPYLVLALLWLPLAIFLRTPTADDAGPLSTLLRALHSAARLDVATGLFAAAVIAYYGGAQRQLGRSPGRAVWLAPLLLPLSIGLAPALSWALFDALRRPADRAVFVRTPKAGDGSTAPAPPQKGSRRTGGTLATIEVALGGIYVALGAVALARGQISTAMGLVGLVAAGLLWVGVGSLRRPPM